MTVAWEDKGEDRKPGALDPTAEAWRQAVLRARARAADLVSSGANPADAFNDPSVVPLSLRERPQWILWRGKKRKMPLRAVASVGGRAGTAASVTDPDSWCTFDQAVAALRRNVGGCDGIGFVVTADDDICGFDLDRVIDAEGYISDDALAIIGMLDSATELSINGCGTHIYCRGGGTGNSGLPAITKTAWGLEWYRQGRYFAVSGLGLCPKPILQGDGLGDGSVNELVDDLGGELDVSNIDIVQRVHVVEYLHSQFRTDRADHGEARKLVRKGAVAKALGFGARELPVDQGKLREMLSFIPADDYATWIRVGMAIYSTRLLNAFDIWEEWSRTSIVQNFIPLKAQKHWDSFDNSVISVGSIYYLAVCNGYRPNGNEALRLSQSTMVAVVEQAHQAHQEQLERDEQGGGQAWGQGQGQGQDPGQGQEGGQNRGQGQEGGQDRGQVDRGQADRGQASRAGLWGLLGKIETKSDGSFHGLGVDVEDTDAANSARLAHAFSAVLIRTPGLGVMSYNGKLWRPDIAQFEAHAGDVLDLLIKREAHAVLNGGNGDRVRTKRLVRWAIKSRSRGRLLAAREGALELLSMTDDESGFTDAAAPQMLACSNGLLDMDLGLLSDYRPDDRIMMACDVAFDPGADCPRWLRFLREVFPDDRGLRLLIQQIAGYIFSGYVSEHKLFIACGRGGNGKSVLFNQLHRMLGSYGLVAPSAVFFQQRGANLINEVNPYLPGKRMLYISETESDSVLKTSLVKNMAADDKVTARPLYKGRFDFSPTHTPIMMTNFLPRILDQDDGVWRRICVVPFVAKFEGEALDSRLSEVLWAERSGILNWVLSGYQAWRSTGQMDMTLSAKAVSGTRLYQQESDILGHFIQEECVWGDDKQVLLRDLYPRYKDWCKQNNEYCLGKNSFGRELKNRFSWQIDQDNRPVFDGFELISRWE